MAETFGEVSKFKCYFEWSIPDFFSHFEKSGESCTSPEFLVGQDTWIVGLRVHRDHSPAFLNIYLKRLTTNGNKLVNLTLAIKTSDGSQHAEQIRDYCFSKKENALGFCHFDLMSEIWKEKSVMVPRNILTVCCTICSEPYAAKSTWDLSTPEYLSRAGSSTRPNILWESLSWNLKDLFLSHSKSDIILKVRGEEFPVHKMILSARSTVFAEMLKQNTAENLVEIPDANPVRFRDLLLFIYSGKVNTLSSENVYDLHALSDKYNLEDLKEACRSFIECPLSVDTVSVEAASVDTDISFLEAKSGSKAGSFCIIV